MGERGAAEPARRLALWGVLLVGLCLLPLLPVGGAHPTARSSAQVLAIDQSPDVTPQGTFTISMHVASTANIQFVYFTFCQLTSPVCYAPVAMAAQASNWYVGTTKAMPNYPGMNAGVTAGYNITIQFSDSTNYTEPALPNAFSNLQLATSVSGEYMYTMTVRNQVFGLGGQVTDAATGRAISGATVALTIGTNSTAANSTVTSATGGYAFAGLVNGSYSIRVSARGYTTSTMPITVQGSPITQNVQLTNSSSGVKSPSGGAAPLHGPVLYAAVGVAVVAAALAGLVLLRWRRASRPPRP